MNDIIRHFVALLVSLCVLCTFVYLHEVTHAEIAKIYDCDSIELSFFPSWNYAASMSADCSNLSDEEYSIYLLAQSNVETVSYNVGFWAMLIFLSLVWKTLRGD